MKDLDEFSENERPYLDVLKNLLENGDELKLKNYILDYELDGLFDDYYMEDLKSAAYYDDMLSIEDMILSYDDYINEYKFNNTDEEEYEEGLYNCRGGYDGDCEDEMLSEDNETATDLNEFTGHDLEFEDLEDLDLE